MVSEIDVIQCYGGPSFALWGGTTSLSAWNEAKKIQKMFLQLGGKILNIQSYHAIRNKCLIHRGTGHAKSIQVYHKSQEYSQS